MFEPSSLYLELDFSILTNNLAGLNCPDWLRGKGMGSNFFLYILSSIHNTAQKFFLTARLESGCGPHFFSIWLFIHGTAFLFMGDMFIYGLILIFLTPWLPRPNVTLINSHCLINTGKKVSVPNLFVGCDSRSDKIHFCIILLDSLQEAPTQFVWLDIGKFTPTWWQKLTQTIWDIGYQSCLWIYSLIPYKSMTWLGLDWQWPVTGHSTKAL